MPSKPDIARSLRHGLIQTAIGFAALALSPNAKAQTPAENKAAVQEKFDAWSAGTGNPFELLADDARWTIEVTRRHPVATPARRHSWPR
jgi:hypothetical protein